MPSAVTESPARLGCVEGARAYLALWVVVCHVLWASGYEADQFSGLPNLLRQGGCAVDVFVIISAFVIFLLMDTKRLSFGQFIMRRFFRLFPLFIALFIIAIPLSQVSLWNLDHAAAYLTPEQIDHRTFRIVSWWQNIQWHVPLHVLMLQGAVPDAVLPESPGAFLDPAWSVSLEWQFYLVAPLAFSLAISARRSRRIALCAVCALVFIAAKRLFPPVMYGAALPFHLEYFFLGAVSYFIYKRYSGEVRADTVFPIAGCLAIFLVGMGGEDRLKLIPVALWVAFFGLILEHRSSLSWRILSSVFTNRVAQRLGRVSYSIYLSHMLVLVVLQYALLRWVPDLSRQTHLWMLLALTLTGTIAASVFLYRFLEAPGIWAGRMLADRFARPLAPARARRELPHDAVRG
jgi:peptidoglycan/LPS O-acetylase OafA/YrhL